MFSPGHAEYVTLLTHSEMLEQTRLTELLNVDYAISHNLTPFISMQNHYNLVYREEEREMYPTLKVHSFPSSGSRSLTDVYNST